MLLALSRARLDVAAPHADSRRLQIGVRTGIWGDALQDKLHQLQSDLPDLALQVESLEPDNLTKRLLDRTLDIAIVYELPSVPEFSCVPIGKFTLKLYSSVKGESLKSALAGNYIYLDWGGGFARFHERRFGDLPTPVLSTNNNELARDYLLANGGACFLPESLQKSLAREGLVLVNDAPDFERQLNVAYHSGSGHRELIERVTDFFVDVKV
jgi:DNA-binding transcriptional LysR family regulator